MTDPAAVLDAHRADAVRRLRELDAAIGALRADRRDDAADDEHDPDGVTLSAEWSRLAGLRSAAARDLAALDAAAARLTAGTYGLCAVCGKPIPAGRLEIRPAATTCVAHAG